MTLGQLLAIRAIVAVAHPGHHLLAVLDHEAERMQREQPDREEE